MGADLRAEPVLERRDDPAPVRVVLRVGGGDHEHVQRQPDPVAPDLHVALLEHVEQAHLDPLGQVRQLVDGEDAPVGAGHQPVVERQLVGQVAALGHPDRVDLADEVGDRRVRGGQLLAVPVVPVHPVQRRVVALLGHEVACVPGHRVVRVVVDLRAGDHRHPLVQQVRQAADEARLGLPPLAEEDHVVAGQQGVLQLRQDRVLVAQHRREQRLPRPDPGHGVAPHLLLDRDRLPADLPQLADRGGLGHGGTLGAAAAGPASRGWPGPHGRYRPRRWS